MFAENGPEFTFLARDTANHPKTTDLDTLFANGVVLTGSLRVPVFPFGLPGTQVFGGNYSTGRYSSIDPSSWINIPGQGVPATTESASWAAYWDFDQCLWVDPYDNERRLGIFGMSGISDGNPNSVRSNATLGLGASGLVPGRRDDTFGAGYFDVATSDNFKEFVVLPPEPPGLAQRNEQGVELYYNAVARKLSQKQSSAPLAEADAAAAKWGHRRTPSEWGGSPHFDMVPCYRAGCTLFHECVARFGFQFCPNSRNPSRRTM